MYDATAAPRLPTRGGAVLLSEICSCYTEAAIAGSRQVSSSLLHRVPRKREAVGHLACVSCLHVPEQRADLVAVLRTVYPLSMCSAD